MNLRLFAAAAIAAAALAPSFLSAQTRTLKISHQFPGGTIDEGDFRDRLVRKFAAAVEKKTNGALKFEIYPGSSLVKTNAQFSAMRKGALDLSLFPLPYAGGEVQELNIGLIPGLVTTYEQGAAWRSNAVGKELAAIMSEKGVVIVSWVWQAGGVASRTQPLVVPEDSKGMKVRGGSREMDMVLKAAGSAVLSIPSNETYAAMQTGTADAVITSSTSLISFRLEEVAKSLTTGRGRAYWFMLEPLLMSKSVFESLPKDQQAAIMSVGEELEKFGVEAAKADDQAVADVFSKAGAKVFDLSEEALAKWVALSRETAWKDYAARNETCARLIKLASETK